MNDDEIKPWLTEEEHQAWAMLRREPDGNASWSIRSLRLLADARKEMAGILARAYAEEAPCPVCERLQYEGHRSDCSFVTMPRPQ